MSLLIVVVIEIPKGSAGAVGDTERGEVACVGVGAAGARVRAIAIAILALILIAVLVTACGEDIAFVELGSVGDAGAHEGSSIGVAVSCLSTGQAFDLFLT